MNLPWTEDAWKGFTTRLARDRLPHALLVTGPRGVGKERLAGAMAASLLCLEPRPEACGECRSCRLLSGGAHPDRFELRPEEGKREIEVDPVRQLIERLGLTTTISPRKVALLVPAEAMNRNAANALLKNLEEPPGETVLVLVSHDPARLPVTIRSRCQDMVVSAPARDVALAWLQAGSDLDADDAALALDAAGGSPLQALELAGDDLLERYRSLARQLETLVGKPSRTSPFSGELASLDGALVWTWLSLAAARALRSALGAATPAWPATEYTIPPVKLAALQEKADRNRRLLASTVRQDLLLKEWLLEWARLPAREPIR